MDNEVLAYLNSRKGSEEAAQITTYAVYINNREVTVNVRDHGVTAGPHRYAVEAYFSDTRRGERDTGNSGYSLGNPEGELREALSNVHWNQFDLTD